MTMQPITRLLKHKPRVCACGECDDLEFVPTGSAQKYHPECAKRRMGEHFYNRRMQERTPSLLRPKQIGLPTAQDPWFKPTLICKTCCGIWHAEERRDALAQAIVPPYEITLRGCAECGEPPGEEPKQQAIGVVRSSAGFLMAQADPPVCIIRGTMRASTKKSKGSKK